MYYEYWGLHKPAFDNVPDPSMYVDCHASMENAIAETLFAIEEGNECLAVIVGDVGLGKTMSLRMIIDTLDPDKYRMALVTNPGVSFGQILQEIIGQLTGKQCQEKRKVQLLETFNRLLFSTLEEGRKILIFIDEANAISPANLENLRLLTNMQGDGRNLFTMVLAGQIEFAKRLENPKRANLFQRVGTYCQIERLESADKVRQYVEKRLALAGATRQIFRDDAFDTLWEQSDRGVPRLVNKLAKLCLKAGETNGFTSITGEMVGQIGSCFHKLSGPVLPKRRSRATRQEEALPDSAPATEQPAASREAAGDQAPDRLQAVPPPAAPAGESGLNVDHQQLPAALAAREMAGTPGQQPPEEAVVSLAGDPERLEGAAAAPSSPEPPASLEEARQVAEETAAPCPSGRAEAPLPAAAEADTEAEMCIGHARITIQIPRQLIKQSLSASREHRCKLAGGLAAETLKKNPQLISSLSADPVPVWLEIRDFVMSRLACAGGM
jgi:general secretion pathway protein A